MPRHAPLSLPVLLPAAWTAVVLGLLVATALPAGAQIAADRRSSAPAPPAGPAPAPAGPAKGDFTLGPGDIIDVEVWGEPNVSGKIPVRPDGKISLPLVGELTAAGATPLQLQAEIGQRLSATIDNPAVTVVVEEVNSRRVNVMGEVLHPGSYSLAGPMTMLDALAMAGGPVPFAHLTRVYMIRIVNGVPWRFPFDYKKVISGHAPGQNVELQPGDTIVVP